MSCKVAVVYKYTNENIEEMQDTDHIYMKSHETRNYYVDAQSVRVCNVESVEEQETDEHEETGKNIWSYDSTIALIASVESHYEDFHHRRKKRKIWEIISGELNSQDVNMSAAACQKKWQNLVRTYKSVIDNKKKSGRGSIRFLFFNRLDEFLGDQPNISNTHSINTLHETRNFYVDAQSVRACKAECVEEQETYERDETEKNIWSYDTTIALIASVESHYEDLQHQSKQKITWETICGELNSQDIDMSAATCKKKWQNLVRSYKSVKDNKKKNGRRSIRFLFFNRLDELLGDQPNISITHTIDTLPEPLPSTFASDISIPITPTSTTPPPNMFTSNTPESQNTRKRKNWQTVYVNEKKKYFAQKQLEWERRREEKEKREERKLELYKKKLELEERKVVALEKLVNIRNNNK